MAEPQLQDKILQGRPGEWRPGYKATACYHVHIPYVACFCDNTCTCLEKKVYNYSANLWGQGLPRNGAQ